MMTLLTTKNDLVVKTAAIRKFASSMTDPFPQTQKLLSYAAARVSRKNQTLFESAEKVQFVRIIVSHERKTHAKRRSKMKFNF